MAKANEPKFLTTSDPLYLSILDVPNTAPGEDGIFELHNSGSQPEAGSLFIEVNPNELNVPIEFVYQQEGDARLLSGTFPSATFEAHFRAIHVPIPQTFHAVIEKMNEGQFLKLGLNDKGICNVPKSRRAEVLKFLGFEVR